MFKTIEPWHEPTKVLQSLPDYGKCEMSPAQHGFLCGMLRKKRPRKVLEVGVAAGGTSCVIMDTLERISSEDGTEVEFHSVDAATHFYRDTRKTVGYMTKLVQKQFPHVRHEEHYGAILPNFIEEIGEGIDFLILDTAHCLPGEVLDFLLAFPFLAEGAVVVLHDYMLPLLVDNPMAHATSVLFEAVQAEKYLLFTDDCPGGVENIAAFTITADTRDSIANVFAALLKRWYFELTDVHAEAYRCLFVRYYGNECLRLFAAAVFLNRLADCREKLKGCYVHDRELDSVLTHWASVQGNVVVYGIGTFGKAFAYYAKIASLRLDAMVVTDGEHLHEVQSCDLPIYHLSKLPYSPKECTVIVAVKDVGARALIVKELRWRGFFHIL